LNPLNIVVCIKRVPDPHYLNKVTLDPVTKTLRRGDAPTIINPLDRHALEEGLQMRNTYGGKVIALSMGRDQTVCREALAMGADEAVQLCDPAFGPGADTLATAYTLSMAIKRMGNFDMVLCGNETVDGGTAQVPPQLAIYLGIPHVTRVMKIDFISNRKVRVERSIEFGYMTVEVTLPAVIAVIREINKPRIPTVQGILESYQKEVKVWTADDIGAERDKVGLAGSPTRIVDFFCPEIRRRGEILKGPPEQTVKILVQRLHELGVL